MVKVAFFSFAFFFCSFLFCSPVNNPSAPHNIEEGFFISPGSSMSFRLGYEGDFISDRRLKQEGLNKRVNEFTQCANSGVLTINVLNRLDVFGTFGEARIKSSWIIENGIDAFSLLEMQTDYKPKWSTGLKAIFFEWGKTSLSFGGRYSMAKPGIFSITKDGRVFALGESDFKFTEWQVDGGVSYKIDLFIPYLCVKYSKAKAEIFVDNLIINSNNTSRLVMESKNNFGMALGCTLTNSKYCMLNVEARLFDEESFTVSGDIRF